MILERSMSDGFLTNTYLVGDERGGTGFFVDAGGPMAPLLDVADERRLEITHVLLTHHHHDHVLALDEIRQAHPDAKVLIDAREPFAGADGEIPPVLDVGALHVRALHTPGHTAGMQSLVVGDHVFTGDTLFMGSIGGVRAPGSTSYADMKESVMEKLMKLPPATRVHPGHTDPTTIGDEWETNAFVRVWRGVDPEGDEPCTALGDPATLVLFGDDYDGGHKAWVRWPDGRDDIVPGSQVQRG